MNNTEVQAIFAQALKTIETAKVQGEFGEMHRDFVRNTLIMGMKKSASGNDMVGLAGRGLRELLTLAEAVEDGSINFNGRLDLKQLALATLGS